MQVLSNQFNKKILQSKLNNMFTILRPKIVQNQQNSSN